MVASASGSALDRPKVGEKVDAPFSEVVPLGGQTYETTKDLQIADGLPDSPRNRETGLVVRLFPTPPQIFGVSYTLQSENENSVTRDLQEVHSESARFPLEANGFSLSTLEAEALSLSRMLESLRSSEKFPGFSPQYTPADPEIPTARRDVNGGRLVDSAALGEHVEKWRSSTEHGTYNLNREPIDNNIFSNGGVSTAAFPYVSGVPRSPKSPRSRRRSPTSSGRSMDSGSSAGSAAELQFPTTNIQSPPSPEPLRPGSPLRWRSRINSTVSPVEDAPAVGEVRETPVLGLVARNLSFSEYISGKSMFEGKKESVGVQENVSSEPELSEVVAKLRRQGINGSAEEFSLEQLLSSMLPLERENLDYSFAMEYRGPPIAHDVPKVEPLIMSPLEDAHLSDAHASPLLVNSVPVTPVSPRRWNGKPPLPLNVATARQGDNGVQSPVSSTCQSSGLSILSSTTRDSSAAPPRFIGAAGQDQDTLSQSSGAGELDAVGQDKANGFEVDEPLASSSEPSFESGFEFKTQHVLQTSLSLPSPLLGNARMGRSEFVVSGSMFSPYEELTANDYEREGGHRPNSSSLSGMQGMTPGGSYSDGAYPSEGSTYELEPQAQHRKKGECYLCHRGHRMTDKESCLVCNAKYCYNCVLTAMESMPEGRKCKTCIGKPIDDVKRACIGKPSRLLNRLLSPQEVQQIMRAEKECSANQLRPEQVFVNGKKLTGEELGVLLGCSNPPPKLKPGKYWYDQQTGLWGKEGEKPDKLISHGLKVGGPLHPKASNGTTQVYMNGRELGKLEWKMLKLAGVHCPPTTHLWVEPDGSYQEEGQKFWKGNIWKKTSIRLLYPFFSLPTPGSSSPRPKDDQRDCPNIYTPDYLKQNKLHRLLLLGHEGSGRSTIYKQAKFLFKDGFTDAELVKLKAMIQGNIFRYISILLEGRERFEEDEDLDSRGMPSENEHGHKLPDRQSSGKGTYLLDDRLSKTARWFLEVMAEGCVETLSVASREYAPLVDELWRDPAIRATYERIMNSKESHGLPDVAKYFLDRVIDISSNEYVPKEEDILLSEGLAQGSGLAEVQFYLEDKVPLSGPYQDTESTAVLSRYQLIKVGGKGMTEGHKWLDMFEDVHAVIFCVAMDEYDETWTDSNGIQRSKMLQTDLFDSVLKHPSLSDKPFVLLLNKYDQFEEKICKGIPLTTCEWFSDFRPVGASQHTAQLPAQQGQMQAQQGYTYIVHKYKELFASAGHKVFTFKLNAIERDKVLEAFHYIREILKWKKSEWEMIPEESSYSTDLSSFSQNIYTSGHDSSPFDKYCEM